MSDDELIDRIQKAKKEKNALILVHSYQRLNIHPVADIIGDSLALAQQAAKTDADMIVFCGVDFMAESAKILCPEKKVILPDKRANCPMALMGDAQGLRDLKKKYPDAVVISYINSSAEVKAESDVICTSSNAVKIVEHFKNKKIIFTPDKNLGGYCEAVTGADMVIWNGHCYVHNEFSIGDIYIANHEHPNCLLIVHPEAPAEVLEHADFIGSTTQLINFVEENLDLINDKAGIIIGTEIEIARMLQKRYPNKPIYPLADHAVCATMKLTTLAKVCYAIENEEHEIEVDLEVSEKALKALDRMLELSK
ncbi:MAG: quinolinate synthase NadA [Candidatus Delongbacteria bacterium]|nr:quinolinate synthase NadA [Candidatus Delongbacteria bacterium]MBN2834304.1 quinolinate synthase NadA [Candidatus Delongbacteria bacterium]